MWKRGVLCQKSRWMTLVSDIFVIFTKRVLNNVFNFQSSTS